MRDHIPLRDVIPVLPDPARFFGQLLLVSRKVKIPAFRRAALTSHLFVFWFNATGKISRLLVPTWSMGTGDTIAECQYHLPIQQNCLKLTITLNKKMSDVIPIRGKS